MKVAMEQIAILRFDQEGIGCDVVEIARFQRAIDRSGNRFLQRLFTEEELTYCLSRRAGATASFAARFAAKEAISKALGVGIGHHCQWLDLSILPAPSGQPQAIISSRLRSIIGEGAFLLSLSHSQTIAIAYAHWKPTGREVKELRLLPEESS